MKTVKNIKIRQTFNVNIGKISIFSLLILSICGCYTQFVTLEDRYPVTADASSSDSTGTVKPGKDKDTVVIKEKEICYWRRNFFGEWELECYESNYPSYWHSYHHRPWWYRRTGFRSYRCHCPYHSYYHPNCEYCWEYCNRQQFFTKKINVNSDIQVDNTTTNKKRPDISIRDKSSGKKNKKQNKEKTKQKVIQPDNKIINTKTISENNVIKEKVITTGQEQNKTNDKKEKKKWKRKRILIRK